MANTHKVTPKGDLSWFIKWMGSILLIIGLSLRSGGIYPLDLYFTLVGSLLWTYVGMLWHDRSIMLVNMACFSIVLSGIIGAWQ